MQTTAFTMDNQFITAREASSHEKYRCHQCGCLMCRKERKINGTAWFACLPGQRHFTDACKKVSANHILRELLLTQSGKFHARLLEETKSRATLHTSNGKARASTFVEEKLLPFNSLSDLWLNGLCLSNNLKIGDGMLSDILISRKFADLILESNSSLGLRALEVMPLVPIIPYNRIRFVFSASESDYLKDQILVFDIHVSDTELLKKITNKLFFSDTNASGKKLFFPKYSVVLLHGNWKALSYCKYLCKERFCKRYGNCAGFQISEFVSSRQLYCPESKKVKFPVK